MTESAKKMPLNGIGYQKKLNAGQSPQPNVVPCIYPLKLFWVMFIGWCLHGKEIATSLPHTVTATVSRCGFICFDQRGISPRPGIKKTAVQPLT